MAQPNPQATYAYISVQPSPIGVGQSMYVSFGVDKVTLTTDGSYGDRFNNFTIVITAPNKDVTHLTGLTTDNTGFGYTTYVPTMIGNYTFQLILQRTNFNRCQSASRRMDWNILCPIHWLLLSTQYQHPCNNPSFEHTGNYNSF